MRVVRVGGAASEYTRASERVKSVRTVSPSACVVPRVAWFPAQIANGLDTFPKLLAKSILLPRITLEYVPQITPELKRGAPEQRFGQNPDKMQLFASLGLDDDRPSRRRWLAYPEP